MRKRTENRVDSEEALRFRYPEVLSGRSRNFSGGGICAEVPRLLAVGMPVEVEVFDGVWLASGRVRWATQAEGAFRVGIEFDEGERSFIRKMKGL